MIKVITYGTYDLLHRGHIRLLERAKALGDYLVVGVTSDDFDKSRGKINVQQSLIERMEAVHALGIADEVIIEEYEGQKIDDILKMEVNIFTVGSDWEGKFDYLKEYCKVVYLDRTLGISSTELRKSSYTLRLGIVGYSAYLNKIIRESCFVNGVSIVGVCTDYINELTDELKELPLITDDYDAFLKNVDAVYVHSNPEIHYLQIKTAIEAGKHVIYESPLCLNRENANHLFQMAKENNCIIQEAIRTAYSTAYYRMLLLLKGGKIGKIVSVDSTCTSLSKSTNTFGWNSIYSWGPTALLPILQILGTDYIDSKIVSAFNRENEKMDLFTKISFIYSGAVASCKVGKGVKSEGELIISGTKGYIYVPAPWWKMDYFEIRYENPVDNQRYFYQLEGEGIRYELVAFIRSIQNMKKTKYIDKKISVEICNIMQDFNDKAVRIEI